MFTVMPSCHCRKGEHLEPKNEENKKERTWRSALVGVVVVVVTNKQ
jgi:hypothetical protein